MFPWGKKKHLNKQELNQELEDSFYRVNDNNESSYSLRSESRDESSQKSIKRPSSMKNSVDDKSTSQPIAAPVPAPIPAESKPQSSSQSPQVPTQTSAPAEAKAPSPLPVQTQSPIPGLTIQEVAEVEKLYGIAKLIQIMDMGFPANFSRIALKRCNGDVQVATNFCIENSETVLQALVEKDKQEQLEKQQQQAKTSSNNTSDKNAKPGGIFKIFNKSPSIKGSMTPPPDPNRPISYVPAENPNFVPDFPEYDEQLYQSSENPESLPADIPPESTEQNPVSSIEQDRTELLLALGHDSSFNINQNDLQQLSLSDFDLRKHFKANKTVSVNIHPPIPPISESIHSLDDFDDLDRLTQLVDEIENQIQQDYELKPLTEIDQTIPTEGPEKIIPLADPIVSSPQPDSEINECEPILPIKTDQIAEEPEPVIDIVNDESVHTEENTETIIEETMISNDACFEEINSDNLQSLSTEISTNIISHPGETIQILDEITECPLAEDTIIDPIPDQSKNVITAEEMILEATNIEPPSEVIETDNLETYFEGIEEVNEEVKEVDLKEEDEVKEEAPELPKLDEVSVNQEDDVQPEQQDITVNIGSADQTTSDEISISELESEQIEQAEITPTKVEEEKSHTVKFAYDIPVITINERELDSDDGDSMPDSKYEAPIQTELSSKTKKNLSRIISEHVMNTDSFDEIEAAISVSVDENITQEDINSDAGSVTISETSEIPPSLDICVPAPVSAPVPPPANLQARTAMMNSSASSNSVSTLDSNTSAGTIHAQAIHVLESTESFISNASAVPEVRFVPDATDITQVSSSVSSISLLSQNSNTAILSQPSSSRTQAQTQALPSVIPFLQATQINPSERVTFAASNVPLKRRQYLPYEVTLIDGKWKGKISLKQTKLKRGEFTPQGNRPHQIVLGSCATREICVDLCESVSPPIWSGKDDPQSCIYCTVKFTMFNAGHHCRNCGYYVCSNCSEKNWPGSMLPATYHNNEKLVRICHGCHYLTESFITALKTGDYSSAVAIYASGNVNLHSPYTLYANWAYPVHCAAVGGNLDLLRWMLETKKCSIIDRATNKPLMTASGLTVLAVAAYKGHVDMMHYLIHTKKCSVSEITDLNILQRALHSTLHVK